MVDAVARAKGLVSLAKEVGFEDLSSVIMLGTDSRAAKSFVCRRGLGKMRHLEIRDLWLQKEVHDGNLIVYKVPREENPADLMTKALSNKDMESRLRSMTVWQRSLTVC
eukprot:1650811-Karenia_brevis.AAC.1